LIIRFANGIQRISGATAGYDIFGQPGYSLCRFQIAFWQKSSSDLDKTKTASLVIGPACIKDMPTRAGLKR
jgi:hypothetical protein